MEDHIVLFSWGGLVFFEQKSVTLKIFFFSLSLLRNHSTKSNNWKNGTLFMWTKTSPHAQKQMLNSILIRPDQLTGYELLSKWSLRALIIRFCFKIGMAVAVFNYKVIIIKWNLQKHLWNVGGNLNTHRIFNGINE